MIAYRTQHPINLRSGPPRSAGHHLGATVRSMALRMGQIDDRYEEDDLDILITRTPPGLVGESGTLTRILIGFAWENYITEHLAAENDTFTRNKELFCEGLFLTRDGSHCDLDTGEMVLDEVKATFKSSRKPICADVPWMWQAAGYLYAMSKEVGEQCTKVEFHPLYIRGDYRGIDPQYLPTMIEYEWQEVLDIWQMLQREVRLGNVKPEGIRKED